MRRRNSHKHENSKDSESAFGVDDILSKGEKEGNTVLDFRSENWEMIYR